MNNLYVNIAVAAFIGIVALVAFVWTRCKRNHVLKVGKLTVKTHRDPVMVCLPDPLGCSPGTVYSFTIEGRWLLLAGGNLMSCHEPDASCMTGSSLRLFIASDQPIEFYSGDGCEAIALLDATVDGGMCFTTNGKTWTASTLRVNTTKM